MGLLLAPAVDAERGVIDSWQNASYSIFPSDAIVIARLSATGAPVAPTYFENDSLIKSPFLMDVPISMLLAKAPSAWIEYQPKSTLSLLPWHFLCSSSLVR